MTITISSTSVISLNAPSSMEPSGLVVVPNAPDQDALFVVSDNGGYAKLPLPYRAPAQWQTSAPTNRADKSDDYECATFAGSTQLVLFGVEGYRDLGGPTLSLPKVLQFNTISSQPIGAFGSYVWTLNRPSSTATTNSGMEALTYLRNDKVPSSWVVTNTLLVLMAVQSEANRAYVYALPVNQGATHTVSKSHDLVIPSLAEAPGALISELFLDADASVLYVLYDDNQAPNDYLQALRWTVTSTGVSLTSINVAKLPWKGCEGMAVYGNDLFFATDTPSGANNGVYQVPGFISGFLNPR